MYAPRGTLMHVFLGLLEAFGAAILLIAVVIVVVDVDGRAYVAPRSDGDKCSQGEIKDYGSRIEQS